jgi:hypothetical protein
MEAAASSSVRVFDGTTDFRVWRARVENELMRYHLLGYVMVRGYDGSQSFTFNGEQVPPRMPVVHVDDEATVKEEASCARTASASQQRRLSRWDVLGESAEAKSILQRFLHPDVECAILNKNIYDSWKILCALYGNRSTPGAHDVYEMHRVLHHIRLGDKKGEPVREFITRWEMLMQQYALATGIELTEGFRSVSLVQTLPSAWRLMVANWRGVKPFVPYAELVEKIISTRERMLVEASAAPTAPAAAPPASNASTDRPRTQQAEKPTGKAAATKPVAKPSEATAKKSASKPADNSTERPADKRAAAAPSSGKPTKLSKPVPPPIDVHAAARNTVDLTSGEVSTGSSPCMDRALTNARDTARKSPAERSDKSTRVDREKEGDSTYEKRDRYSKYESSRGYDKYASYDHDTTRSLHGRYEKKHDGYERFDSKGPVSCFYCLKVGHHMKRCWFLQADIENGTTHDPRRKYSCSVTLDRSTYMVNCLEAYIEEMNRERARYGGSLSAATTPRSHRDYEVSESAGRVYKPQRQELVPPPPPGQPSSYAYREQPSSSSATDYHKRSHSVFQPAEGRLSSRDPRLNRSRSVYRSTDIPEDFSPRKRARAPSFEKQLQSYY